MNQDPLISGGIVKAALIILFAGAIGLGAYFLADGGIDLPDIDLEDLGEQSTTNLSDTDLSDTTIEPVPEVPVPEDTFDSRSLSVAIDNVRDVAGEGRTITRLVINEVQTQFTFTAPDGVEILSVRADSPDEVVRQTGTISISGNATIEDFAFPLNLIQPAAVDRMLSKAENQSGFADFEPTVLSYERRIPFGERELEWTINAQGGGTNLLFRADPSGRKVVQQGEGTQIPQAAQDAQKLGECIEAAGQDTQQILACLEDNAP